MKYVLNMEHHVAVKIYLELHIYTSIYFALKRKAGVIEPNTLILQVRK